MARLRMVRIECDRPVETLDRLWPPPERQQGQRAVEPGLGKSRISRDRAVEAVERKLGAAESLLRDGDEIMRGGIFRIELDRLAGKLDPVGQAALLAMDRRQQEMRIDILLVLRQDLLVARG